MHQYWQVAAGNSDRNYSSLFLKHGLAFLGGNPQIQLAREVRKGDVLILKDGLHKILAAGLVVERDGRIFGCGDKEWVRDVEGWDLKAYLHVDWHPALSQQETSGLTRSTISRTHNADHRAIADKLLTLPKLQIEPEPGEPTILHCEDIVAALKERDSMLNGPRIVAVLENIGSVYAEFAVAEKWKADETAERLVRPLLLALGWHPDDIRDDAKGAGLTHLLCCFPKERRNASTDVVVIDCRPFYQGVDLSPEQSMRVGKVFTGARALAVTNGVAVKLYSKSEHGPFKTEPAAYVNLARPAERCPWDPRILGAVTALRFIAKPG